MKRVLSVIFGLLTLVCSAIGQTSDNGHYLNTSVIGLYGTDYAKAAVEATRGTNNTTGYAYVELGWGTKSQEIAPHYAYSQLFWEQKFWEFPVFMHAEFRTTLSRGEWFNVGYFGGAYCVYSKHGFFAIEPLYRFNRFDGHGGQLSLVGGWEWKWCDIATYTDLWWTQSSLGHTTGYHETRFYVKIIKNLEIGIIGILNYAYKQPLAPGVFGGIKINL